MPQIHRLYIPDVDLEQDTFVVDGQHAKIISQVLRLREGADITVLDGQGGVLEMRIENIVSKKIHLRKICMHIKEKLSPAIHISVGALKGEKSSWVLQKLTEIGVAQISFFQSEHTVSKLSAKKIEKYNLTCAQALRQSGNPYLPTVSIYQSVQDCLDQHVHSDIKICLHEKEQAAMLSSLMQRQDFSCHVMVGPEGGFSDGEIDMMQSQGYHITGCAPYVLRAETAALYCASFIRASWNEEVI